MIQSVPGIKELSALIIFSEIGADMSAFLSDKHLCSWAGLAPSNDQSAGKKKSVRISRAGVYLKLVLVQCAKRLRIKNSRIIASATKQLSVAAAIRRPLSPLLV
ncbi:MAG: IS110 family transposase [Bacillota bacterium]